jgi:hypothetical protein
MLFNRVCRDIADRVRVWLKTDPRQIVISDGQRVRESLEDYFARVLQPKLGQQLPDINAVEREVVALMVYLGPEEAAFPPFELREELIGHANSYASGLPDEDPGKRLVQLALAYGCQWRRSAQSDLPRWDTHWSGAMQELTDVAEHFVVQACNVLVATVRDFQRLEKYKLRDYAQSLTGEFVAPAPAGTAKHHEFLRLYNWQPAKGNLYGYLQHAIQGEWGRQSRFTTNMFNQGLLFPLLKEDGHLDSGPVAFKQCLSTQNSSCENEGEFEKLPCGCGQPYAPKQIYILDKELLIVPGVYVPRPFWRCHKGFYEWTLSHCPHCATPRGQRETFLWVRAEWALASSLSKEAQDAIEEEMSHETEE